MSTYSTICAVIVTFHPDQDFPSRFDAIAEQVDKVFVVDNGSSSEAVSMLKSLVDKTEHQFIHNLENLGIAAALNQGAQAALADGYEWAVTLDQDSLPAKEMTRCLVETLARRSTNLEVALVGPSISFPSLEDAKPLWVRAKPRYKLLFERVTTRSEDLEDVTYIITSGALTNLNILQKLGFFREDYFIDYVDIEYCLRAKQANYAILVSASAHLEHRLGEISEKSIGAMKFRPRYHNEKRVYFLYRNRIITARKYTKHFPHWFLFDTVQTSYNLVRILAFENNRMQKFRSALRGTFDGLLGKTGPQ